MFKEIVTSFVMFRSFATLEYHYAQHEIVKLIEPIDNTYESALEQVSSDVELRQNTFQLTIESIELLTKQQTKLFDRILELGQLPQNDIIAKKLTLAFFAQAAKLNYLQATRPPNDEILLHIADTISAFTRHASFTGCIAIVSTTIAEAAKIQMRFFEMAPQDSALRNEILDRLREDHKALGVLRERYKVITSRFGFFMEKLNQFVHQNEEKQRLLALYSSLKNSRSDDLLSTLVSKVPSPTNTPYNFGSFNPTPEVVMSPFGQYLQSNGTDVMSFMQPNQQQQVQQPYVAQDDLFTDWANMSNSTPMNTEPGQPESGENLELFINDLLWSDDAPRTPDVPIIL
jgi:hypothetical protein